jgi:GMP synthase (glutamine-hydrolysing)
MGKAETQLLFINPLNADENGDVPSWIAAATGLPEDHITTVNIANGGKLPTDLRRFAGIIGGGSRSSVFHDVPWISEYEDFMKTTAELEIPQLHICFSHQLKAQSEGATVEKVGSYRYGTDTIELTPDGQKDPLFEGLPKQMVLFVVNGDYVTALPNTSLLQQPVELARSKNHPNEALAYGRNIRTVQFHPERTAAVMADLARRRQADPSRPLDVRSSYTWFLVDNEERRKTEAEANGKRIVKNWMRHYVAPYQRDRSLPLPIARPLFMQA